MTAKFLLIILVFILSSCSRERSHMEVCFERLEKSLKPDSILNELKYSSLEHYKYFGSRIRRKIIEQSKTDTICSDAVNEFVLEDSENSITVNNLIMFQQFQAYLRHEDFDFARAKKLALEFEAKWK